MTNLRKQRREKGYTCESLGAKVGVQKSAMSKYERGEIQPSHDILMSLSKVLDCSTDFLLGLSDVPKAFLSTKNNGHHSSAIENTKGWNAMNDSQREFIKEGIKMYFKFANYSDLMRKNGYFEKCGLTREKLAEFERGNILPTHREFWHMMGAFRPFEEAPMECYKALAILAHIRDQEKSDAEQVGTAFLLEVAESSSKKDKSDIDKLNIALNEVYVKTGRIDPSTQTVEEMVELLREAAVQPKI